jgi:hypothetical protein
VGDWGLHHEEAAMQGTFWRRLLAVADRRDVDPDEGVFGEGDFGWILVEDEPVGPGDEPGPDAYQWSPE